MVFLCTKFKITDLEKYTLTDDLGTMHVFNQVPQRIVSLVPSQTELLVDLGLEANIVGITKFCVHPEDLRKRKTIVGGTKKVDYTKISDLQPDIIICNKEENTLEIVENLRHLYPVWVTDIETIEDNFKMIADFGQLFSCVAKAEKLNAEIQNALSDFNAFIEKKPIKKVAYFIWKNPYMVAGGDNFIHQMLQLNHFENAFGNQSRYPEVHLQNWNEKESLDCIFLSSEPYPFKEKDISEIASFCPSTKNVLVDGEMFSWHGSRLLLALDYFKELQQKL